ncbi:DNA repair metallo-beta-lactamase family protein [Trichomonas vaginalis G3]|uniref:DNA repair metallo-beta-lactamase family protein n=1 Tax=Trichomonas vaginalis (strain ATCC PRA-98 / G3) TaxID=412133 RepID=A2GFK2_TRIV3|nr:protection from non-homologous end joining at telomere [Trichomonas vaginalis G3]EAX84063.1 DNA repair metallo-beta-lactamase family protein [Trichomonas vaginalis G3]KAI5512473.1 protection from non-homologous end joining at telomere [Trichomonas vaginalis G3]|eukprot:XP_001296993.1 DNA repair metallo-beta-lactamase family protein [Trichomonas vaginalis G3]
MEGNSKDELKLPPARALVPGTDFTVDWHCKTDPKYVHSFLSHAHSDHIAGIPSFKPPRVLHCTPITAKIILLRYPRLAKCIQIHEYNSEFIIDAITIRIINANHTPGSCMFLFETPLGRKILHTGDFRADNTLIESIKKFCPVNQLFIDCTYATSKLLFLSRQECINWTIERVIENMKSNTLTLIGTYTLGKEELVLAISNKLSIPIYAPKDRYKGIVEMIKCGYCSESCFTNDPTKTRVYLVPIMDCNSVSASVWAKQNGYSSVCAIAATGWSGKAGWKNPQITYQGPIKVTLYEVPYSDHSSPQELLNFVKVVKPKKLVSTTSRSQKEEDKIQQMFLPFIRKEKSRGFIDFYTK